LIASRLKKVFWPNMKKKRILVHILIVLGLAIITGNHARGEGSMLTLTSTVFQNNGEIPSLYTCEGQDLSPPLEWRGVPAGTRSLVLIVDDPDAPDPRAPRMTWVHWVLYNLPPDSGELPEGTISADLPAGTREGLNDWKRVGYGGPCPPVGRHRYFHKLYALDTVLDKMDRPNKAKIEAAMQGHILAQTELVGTYQKAR
jgi:Raf kinase inhibitor-like YbhB/YbcL family protein